MPLQWLPLQQRQQQGKQQARSPISQALKQPQRQFLGTMDTSNRFVDEQKAKWAEEDKMKKLERDKQTQGAQELGMRVGKAIQGQQQQEEKVVAEENIKEAMPDMAKETWKFISELDEAGQQFYINHLKQKEYGGAASTISLTNEPYDPETDTVVEDKQRRTMFVVDKNGKKKMVILQGGGGMYAEMVKQGLLNPSDDTVIKKKVEGEINRFKETKDGGVLDTMTGKKVVDKNEIPVGITPEIIADGYNFGRLTMASMMEATVIEKITPENMAGHIEKSKEEAKIATEGYLTAQIVATGMDLKQAKIEAKKIAYNMSDEDLGITTKIGRDALLDEEKAKGLADYLKSNPDIDLEAYRDRDGDATVDRALEINKKPEPIIKPTTTLPKPTTTVTKPKKETTVKEYLNKWGAL